MITKNVGDIVTFTDNSNDASITSYNWNFGDGNIGTGNPATHVYTSPNTYTVTHSTTNNCGTTPCAAQPVQINAQTLVPSVSVSPGTINSSQTSTVTVHVAVGASSVSGASVAVGTNGGTLNPTSGTTDINGNFASTYTAPSVTTSTSYTISATASGTGYTSGSGSNTITVNPVTAAGICTWITSLGGWTNIPWGSTNNSVLAAYYVFTGSSGHSVGYSPVTWNSVLGLYYYFIGNKASGNSTMSNNGTPCNF